MILKQGNMWDAFDSTEHFLITANSFIKRNGNAVLGRGIAKQASDKYTSLPQLAGMRIQDVCGHLGKYGCVSNVLGKIGLFQVKLAWHEDARLDLIKYAVDMLTGGLEANPKIKSVCLNFPGIGNGGLQYTDVLPIISELPDSVHVWTYYQGSER